MGWILVTLCWAPKKEEEEKEHNMILCNVQPKLNHVLFGQTYMYNETWNLNRRGIMTPTNRKNFWEVVGSGKREENMGKYKKLVSS